MPSNNTIKKALGVVGFIILIVTIGIAACVGDVWLSWNPQVIWRSQQQTLAESLGVVREDGSLPSNFPVGYFRTKLVKGTDILEVHRLVQGYTKVLACNGRREVYYYFSWRDEWALRLEVVYDENLLVKGINGEDEDSRSIGTKGCFEVRLSN